MLRAAFLVAALALPMMASAQASQDARWRRCTQTSDCIMIQGTCDMTAVNIGYKNEAVKYYKELARSASCVEKFWVAKKVKAECKPLAGSKADEDAEVTPHSACAVVAQTPEKKK